MSFQFWLVLLLLPALGFLVVPYLRRGGFYDQDNAHISDTNVQLYEARLQELESELAAGQIQQSEFKQLEEELGLSLLVDTRASDSEKDVPGPFNGRMHLTLAACSALVIILCSLFMYAQLGAWPEIELQKAARVLELQDAPAEEMQDFIQLLNSRLLSEAEDTNSWYLLGHAHLKQGSFPQAVRAFSKLSALVRGDVNVDTSLAQARYMADDGNISTENRTAMLNILKRAPHQPLILEMLAIEAFKLRDASAAIRYLEQGLAGGLTGQRAESFRSGIQRAREMASGNPVSNTDLSAGTDNGVEQNGEGARILVQLSLDPSIQASADTVVFVIAREQGGMPMPLAVKRLRVGDLPVELQFTDADAMVQSRLLSQFETVELVARLSYSGQPSLQPGDIETRLGDIVVARSDAPIVLRLEP